MAVSPRLFQGAVMMKNGEPTPEPVSLPIATGPTPQPASVPSERAHFPLDDLRWSGDEGWMPKSQALLCQKVPTMAIVFVHGFGGGADSTWEQFVRCLRAMPEAAVADAFFIDYPSTKHPVAFCSAKFREFLFDLLRKPSSNIVNPSLPKEAPTRAVTAAYQKIMLVGHSMGAIVARQALLDLDRDALTSAERAAIYMLFFAPAHKGARSLGKLVASGFGLDKFPGGQFLGALLLLRYRSVADLTKESDCLSDLATHSKARREDRAREGQSADYLRAHVYHAENDRIVYVDTFDDDYSTNPVMAQNHRSVCKPRKDYPKPAEALRSLL